jgi:hypothetical protein
MYTIEIQFDETISPGITILHFQFDDTEEAYIYMVCGIVVWCLDVLHVCSDLYCYSDCKIVS